eukprot:Plantae.Rhodophyta-Purpureofilum_apyrenoidigerum.ctg11224.p1 GENE.Plantae.Rhodophyta-Purpureofilum_apyrenoidigerum.ctg11224~~Plantae.Rhodophyta-Purpureofilum_apyrenoidigerum.ctg11224.p1  ORF type:complete len:662 (+),score=129.19 Plantae.Rhodophyta-Purpureofilum_apyrenoidigerum.ctg11224:94-2079(+)
MNDHSPVRLHRRRDLSPYRNRRRRSSSRGRDRGRGRSFSPKSKYAREDRRYDGIQDEYYRHRREHDVDSGKRQRQDESLNRKRERYEPQSRHKSVSPGRGDNRREKPRRVHSPSRRRHQDSDERNGRSHREEPERGRQDRNDGKKNSQDRREPKGNEKHGRGSPGRSLRQYSSPKTANGPADKAASDLEGEDNIADDDIVPPREKTRAELEEEEYLYKPAAEENFVWKKKNEKLKKMGLNPDLDPASQEKRRHELQRELQKAKIKRLERERERADWEAEQARIAREKEAEENEDWEYKEEMFHATNFYLKQAVRLKEHRPFPADYLARNSRVDLDNIAPDPNPPYEPIAKISVDRLKEIITHIDEELRFVPFFNVEGLDTDLKDQKVREEFWRCLKLIATSTLEEREFGDRSSSGMHQSVKDDVETLLKGKSHKQLTDMCSQIESTLSGGGDIDVEYWETILVRVKFNLARARVDEINSRFLEYKTKNGHINATSELQDQLTAYGNEDEMLKKEVNRGMGENEAKFSEEVNVDRQYAWNDKYKPRKPKYFNRVHTGYEWNKYNQTHYDHDNPPPKTVQGYKFNIFYPDLIDKSRSPTFKIEKTDNPDVCIIRFIAGPPYEDIAFKIVNREWEHSHKKGFRCTFERGILHLWVNFKRMRYRR